MAEDIEVDARGLNCPLPVLRAKKALRKLGEGGVMHVLATDPGAVRDFEAFCRVTGNDLVESSEADGVYTFLIRKTG